ncbi:Glycosyl transferase family 2 [Rhizoctonia solani]|uniref:dolichyl-phosphate beta-glucosyltransferase n=1 Tax=Rhizoctonia solani TaxID=456999 RepID=A0A8H7H659_9AGAM|nr:Glycosyl transferase family 2 [Rhizoctonia solani]
MLLALTLTTVCLFLVLVYILLVVLSPSIPTPGPEAFKYRSNSEPTIAYPLPSSTAPAECDLSVVIPAYNEAKRLPPMLTEALNHVLGNKLWRSVEFLIVDDGSKDNTADVALEFPVPEDPKSSVNVSIRVVKLPQNSGKGSAVKHGMLHARGERMLMVDADGASKFSDLDKLWVAMDNGADVVCGSRAHLVGTDAVVKRSFIRNTLMYGLHTLLRFLGVSHIRDTQCGFKLFTRPAAHTLFQTLHIPHWIFDVELLVVALMCGMKTDEVAVGWHEVAGSKINILWDTLEMLRDLLVLRANYVTGRWKVVRVHNAQANESAGNGHVTDLENKSAANLRRRVVDATQK